MHATSVPVFLLSTEGVAYVLEYPCQGCGAVLFAVVKVRLLPVWDMPGAGYKRCGHEHQQSALIHLSVH